MNNETLIPETVIKVVLVDDHSLLRNALADLIDSFENFKVISHATNGKELIDQVSTGLEPDVILLDLNMPEIDGYETAKWLHKNRPEIPVLMLTMYNSESVCIRLMGAGVRGFLQKDVHPLELRHAIYSVATIGHYYTPHISAKFSEFFKHDTQQNLISLNKAMFNDDEIQFLKMAATELTYKEIASEMQTTPRVIDSIRDDLFQKLDIKSRVGLVMFAVTRGFISI